MHAMRFHPIHSWEQVVAEDTIMRAVTIPKSQQLKFWGIILTRYPQSLPFSMSTTKSGVKLMRR